MIQGSTQFIDLAGRDHEMIVDFRTQEVGYYGETVKQEWTEYEAEDLEIDGVSWLFSRAYEQFGEDAVRDAVERAEEDAAISWQ